MLVATEYDSVSTEYDSLRIFHGMHKCMAKLCKYFQYQNQALTFVVVIRNGS